MAYEIGTRISFFDQFEEQGNQGRKLWLVGTKFRFSDTSNGLKMAVKIPIVYS